MQQRRDEILAKKAKLAELKRQRELRATQASAGRQSLGITGDLVSPTPRGTDRQSIETLINSLVGESRPSSTGPGGAASPAHRGSRPNSVLSAGELSTTTSDYPTQQQQHQQQSGGHPPPQPLSLSTAPLIVTYECPPSPVKEIFSYSKGVQTSDDLLPPAPSSRPRSQSDLQSVDNNNNDEPASTSTPSKRLSRRRDRDREEELRQNIRREIEDELQAAQELAADGLLRGTGTAAAGLLSTRNFPARALTDEELDAVTASGDFVDFLERSTKVIEKALDQEYDILTDYTLQDHGLDPDGDPDGQGGGVNSGGRGRRRVKEVRQFYDDRWSRKRMVTSIDFSPRFPDLVLASYTKNPAAPHDPDGIVQVWNLNLHDRPEFVFHAQSDVLTAKFSPFHPNLIVGGAYSGQVLLWDTRAKSAPVQKTPLTGSGHTHPVYAVDIVGTQNANNIISCSTDGDVCGWTVDMLAQPQESLALVTPPPAKTENLSPICMAFPDADPTFFLVGSEEGAIFPCHRYDRAGAKAGVDARVSYRGHAAPVASVDFHPARGPVDLGDLVLSSSLDWSVKLWRVRAPATTAAAVTPLDPQAAVAPLLDLVREDVVYDAAWSPVRPGVFGLVDGAGWLEVWDLTVETEEPVARVSPARGGSGGGGGGGMMASGLNKLAWEKSEGKRLAVGGLSGALTVFEVGVDLGGKETLKNDEWTAVKKLVGRIEAGVGSAGAGAGNGVNGVVA